jgi:hypothetical protein
VDILGQNFRPRPKILPLFFGELKAGRAKTLEAEIKQETRKVFLKTNELSIEGENYARPVNSFSLPKQAYERAEPKRGERSKTTVASTTQHAQNSHRAMQAATHITISLTSAYRYSNLSASRLFHQKPFGYSPQKGYYFSQRALALRLERKCMVGANKITSCAKKALCWWR